MEDSSASDLFSPMMVVVWGVLAAAILLLVIWRVSKHRSRQRRREAARLSKRQLHEWREGSATQPEVRNRHQDSIPH